MISSDAFETQVCELCGMLGYNGWCPKCKTGKGIVKLTMPYAAKLLIQEVSLLSLLRDWRIADRRALAYGNEHIAEAMFGGYGMSTEIRRKQAGRGEESGGRRGQNGQEDGGGTKRRTHKLSAWHDLICIAWPRPDIPPPTFRYCRLGSVDILFRLSHLFLGYQCSARPLNHTLARG